MVSAANGVAVGSTSRASTSSARRSPPGSARRAVHLGPADDEVTVVSRDAITVYDRATGTARRHAAFDQGKSDGEPQWGAGTRSVFFALGTKLVRLDLVAPAMSTTILEDNTFDGPVGSADGSRIAWLDRAHVVHVVASDAKPGAHPLLLHPLNGPLTVALSATGDRIGAVAERSVTVFDGAGKELHDIQTEPNESLVQLRGDDMWAGTPIGLVRHYRGENLVASLPSHVTEIEDLRVRGDTLAAAGSDGSLVALDARAEIIELDPDVCEHGSLQRRRRGGRLPVRHRERDDRVRRPPPRRRARERGPADRPLRSRARARRRRQPGRSLAVFDADGKPLARTPACTSAEPFADSPTRRRPPRDRSGRDRQGRRGPVSLGVCRRPVDAPRRRREARGERDRDRARGHFDRRQRSPARAARRGLRRRAPPRRGAGSHRRDRSLRRPRVGGRHVRGGRHADRRRRDRQRRAHARAGGRGRLRGLARRARRAARARGARRPDDGVGREDRRRASCGPPS